MNWEMIIAMTSVMLFAYWFVYCLGSPLASDLRDVDVRAIFFAFPWWLARRRLNEQGLLKNVRKNLTEELQVTTDRHTRQNLYLDHKRHAFGVARDFFTWERSLLCPVCFHWWLTVILVVISLQWNLLGIYETPWQWPPTYLVNHFFIRKIS